MLEEISVLENRRETSHASWEGQLQHGEQRLEKTGERFIGIRVSYKHQWNFDNHQSFTEQRIEWYISDGP